MSRRNEEAPLFVCAYDFYNWLLDRFEHEDRFTEVCKAVLGNSRSLLENVALALSGHSTGDRVADADEDLVRLRLHLRLAAEKHLIDHRRLLYATEQMRDIGRQIGGWRKRLGEVG